MYVLFCANDMVLLSSSEDDLLKLRGNLKQIVQNYSIEPSAKRNKSCDFLWKIFSSKYSSFPNDKKKTGEGEVL